MNREQKLKILEKLEQMYPEAKAELVFSNPYEMLVATILSAQCTDRQVNKVTPAVFSRYPDPVSMASADVSDLYPMVKSCGFSTKASNIISACRIIPKEKWGQAHHWLIWHGRRLCKARNPLCRDCELKDLCPYRKTAE